MRSHCQHPPQQNYLNIILFPSHIKSERNSKVIIYAKAAKLLFKNWAIHKIKIPNINCQEESIVGNKMDNQ